MAAPVFRGALDLVPFDPCAPGVIADEGPGPIDGRALSLLLRQKSETLAQMSVTTEQEWPALMARYLAHCRVRPLHAVAMYTLLSDFTAQIMDLAARRHLPIHLVTVLPASSVAGGCEPICDSFERCVVDAFRAGALWPRAAWDLPRIVAYVEDVCAMRLGAGQLALHTGWKPVPLLRAFKKHTGMTVHEYLTHARIRRATALLGAGEKVEWVIQQVGYRNRTNFNREFRRIVGCGPGEFKRRRREAAEPFVLDGALRTEGP